MSNFVEYALDRIEELLNTLSPNGSHSLERGARISFALYAGTITSVKSIQG